MEQSGEVGVDCWAQRWQPRLGSCTALGNMGHWHWLREPTERWEGVQGSHGLLFPSWGPPSNPTIGRDLPKTQGALRLCS